LGRQEPVAALSPGSGPSPGTRPPRSPAPPEPCPLPLAACSIRAEEYVVKYDNVSDAPLHFGPWQRTWAARDYAAAVRSVRGAIERGDVYQVNLVQHLSAGFDGDPGTLAARLA